MSLKASGVELEVGLDKTQHCKTNFSLKIFIRHIFQAC